MISKGSCDTEDWSNDAKNSDLTSQKCLKYTKVEKKDNFNIL